MIVCIDSGNTRIKWGVHDDGTWIAQGVADQADAPSLAALCAAYPLPERVVVANVAGAVAWDAIDAALDPWRERLVEVKASAAAAGVSNGYRQPASLGVDRWCALVGAWGLLGRACVVVGAGTATTIDSLDGSGCFLGGFILPGFDMMCAALARDTAGLPLAPGSYAEFPGGTADAIHSGAIEATVGAIERACERLGGAPCLLFGGASTHLEKCLRRSWRSEPLLVLEGLRRLATAARDTG